MDGRVQVARLRAIAGRCRELAEMGDGLLSVSDNGLGMPVGEKQWKTGLGTGIVEALSKQLDASVIVLDAKPGTRVEVRHGKN